MSTRAVLAVELAVVLLLASVGPVAGIAGAPTDRASPPAGQTPDATVNQTGDALAQYKVSGENVTIRTWLLRNSTVLNATVGQVVIRNVTTPDGGRTNVTISNVTVGRFVVDRAKLSNVTMRKLIIRNKSVFSVPGGEFIDPNIKNRTIERQWIQNATVSGVVIGQITVNAAAFCRNASLGTRTNDSAAFDPRNDSDKPDVTVTNGSVEEALIMRGTVSNWSVGSVDQSGSTNVSLPQACNHG